MIQPIRNSCFQFPVGLQDQQLQLPARSERTKKAKYLLRLYNVTTRPTNLKCSSESAISFPKNNLELQRSLLSVVRKCDLLQAAFSTVMRRKGVAP